MFKLDKLPALGKEQFINEETKEKSEAIFNSNQIVDNGECLLRLHHPSFNELEKPNFETAADGDDVKNEYQKLDLNYAEALPDQIPELGILSHATDDNHHNYKFADGQEHEKIKDGNLIYLPNIEKGGCTEKTENNDTVGNEGLGIAADDKNFHDYLENAATIPEPKLEFTKEEEDLLDEYIDYFTQISDHPENESDQSKTDECENTTTSNEAKNEQIYSSVDVHTNNKEMNTDDIFTMRYKLGMQIAISENFINEHLELSRNHGSVWMDDRFYLQTRLERIQKDRQWMMQLDRKVDPSSIERNYEISQNRSANEYDVNDAMSYAKDKHRLSSFVEVSLAARSVDLNDTSDKNAQGTPLNVDDVPQNVTVDSSEQQLPFHEEHCANAAELRSSPPEMIGRLPNRVDDESIVKPFAKENEGIFLKAIEALEDSRESKREDKENLSVDVLKGFNDLANCVGVAVVMKGAKSGDEEDSDEIIDSTNVLCLKNVGYPSLTSDKLEDHSDDYHDNDNGYVRLLVEDVDVTNEAHVIASHIVNDFINCITWKDTFNVIDIESSNIYRHQDLMTAGSNSNLPENVESNDASKSHLILPSSNETIATLNQLNNNSESLLTACKHDGSLLTSSTEHVTTQEIEINQQVDALRQETPSSQAKFMTKAKTSSDVERGYFSISDLNSDGKESSKIEFSILSESFPQSNEALKEIKEVPELLEADSRTLENNEDKLVDVPLSTIITCIGDQTYADELHPSESTSFDPIKEVSDASHSQPEHSKSFQVRQLKTLEYNDLLSGSSDSETTNGSKTPGVCERMKLLDSNCAADLVSFDSNAREGFNSDASFVVGEWIDLSKSSAYYLNNTLCEESMGNWLSKSFVKETLSENQQIVECQDGGRDNPGSEDNTICCDVEREDSFCVGDDSEAAMQSDHASSCTQESKNSTKETDRSLSDSEAGIAIQEDSDKISVKLQDLSKPYLFDSADFEHHGFFAKNPSPIVGGAFQNKRSWIGDNKGDDGWTEKMKKRKTEKCASEFSVVPQLDHSKDNEDFQTMFEGKDVLLSSSYVYYFLQNNN